METAKFRARRDLRIRSEERPCGLERTERIERCQPIWAQASFWAEKRNGGRRWVPLSTLSPRSKPCQTCSRAAALWNTQSWWMDSSSLWSNRWRQEVRRQLPRTTRLRSCLFSLCGSWWLKKGPPGYQSPEMRHTQASGQVVGTKESPALTSPRTTQASDFQALCGSLRTTLQLKVRKPLFVPHSSSTHTKSWQCLGTR